METVSGVHRRWGRLSGIAAISVLVVLLLAIGLGWGNLRSLLNYFAPAARTPSLAVLPFDSLSNDPTQNFLAESMTEQVITESGQSRGLRVLSRGSVMRFSGKHLPLERIGFDLQVDDVVEGSVSQSVGRLRVTANLYQVATRKHLWAQTYELDAGDGFTPQRDITQNIAARLSPR